MIRVCNGEVVASVLPSACDWAMVGEPVRPKRIGCLGLVLGELGVAVAAGTGRRPAAIGAPAAGSTAGTSCTGIACTHIMVEAGMLVS
mmetsp:Transcript_34453/g.61144  ORF Transcript_34453/g.61144 Transcript_34453/m.61144 type:complete len:88 (+) Transcript_34453:540-803(+)